MNRLPVVVTVILLAACGGASPTAPGKPAGIDPSILLVSQTPDSVWVTWASDSGLTTIIVPPGASTCTRWTQGFDSLYVYIRDSVPGQPVISTLTTPWVQLADYPYYFQVDTASRSIQHGGAAITEHFVATEC